MEQPAFDYNDSWKPQGFDTYYTQVLSQEHHLPFMAKLKKAILDVLIPCPCSKYGYVMSRSDLRSGAILSLVFALVVSLVDAFSLIAPCIPFAAKSNEKYVCLFLFLFCFCLRNCAFFCCLVFILLCLLFLCYFVLNVACTIVSAHCSKRQRKRWKYFVYWFVCLLVCLT